MGTAVEEKQSRSAKKAYPERAVAIAERAREAFRIIRKSPAGVRNRSLLRLGEILLDGETGKNIRDANARDLENARSANLSDSMIDRLRLDEKGLASISAALKEIAAFPDPVGEVTGGRTLTSGVRMIQKRVPLGVIFTVFESRPNVTVDVGALCVKSGNGAILRGGKEAINTNLVLAGAFRRALEESGLPADCVLFVDDPDRAYMLELLKQDGRIDLVVPRGGEALISFVTSNTRIPVVKHDRGVCNMYIDRSADTEMALRLAVNAKLQKPSVRNAIENLLIHAEYPGTKELLEGLRKAGAVLLGCERTRVVMPDVMPASDSDYAAEFLDNRLAVQIVNRVEDAVAFIHRFGSAHSEAVVSEDRKTIEIFSEGVDSAAVFVNCSTRFHDGGQMGMGAEVGISTGRLHVRGPMGVRDLTTTTYVLSGDGQVRG